MNVKQKLLSAMIASQLLSIVAAATDEVPIAPVLSSGSNGVVKNFAPNIWFTIDDSGSMGALGQGIYAKPYCRYVWWEKVCTPNRWEAITSNYDTALPSGTARVSGGRLVYGYVPYDPTIAYENYIPVDHEGNKLPLPDNVNLTYKLAAYPGGYNLPKDVFVSYAKANLDVNIAGDLKTAGQFQTVAINKTFKVVEEEYGNTFTSLVVHDDSCDKATNKKRCQVWKTYYSTRLLAVKSGLSLALYEHRETDFRFGFQELWKWKGKKGNRYIALGGNEKYTPDIERIQTFPLKKNTNDNFKALYQWLFTLSPDAGGVATPTRGVISALFKEIKDNGGPNGAIYLEDPSKEHHAINNPALTCRRNQNVIFTDGQWEGIQETDVKADLQGFSAITSESTNFLLPDGTRKYNKRTPYSISASTSITNLADIAFKGWATDLDGIASNNAEGQQGSVFSSPKEFIDENGKDILYKNDGSLYWQHFNDPATWQHINTHAIGFSLNEDKYSNIVINPPQTKEEALALKTATFGLDNFINGTAKWEKSNSVTIPWNLAVADMARAAITGRGLFFNAQSGKDVYTAFDRIMDTAGEVSEAPKSVKGSGGVTGNSQSIGSAHYSTRFDTDTFGGELIKKDLFDGKNTSVSACFDGSKPAGAVYGTLCTKDKWNAGKVLTAMKTSSRNLISIKRQYEKKDLTTADTVATIDPTKWVTYDEIEFAADKLSPAQSQRIADSFTDTLKNDTVLGTTVADKITTLFNYIAGAATYENTHFKSRNAYPFKVAGKIVSARNILGAIMRSSPVYTDVPRISDLHPAKLAPAYRAFVQNYVYTTNPKTGVSKCNGTACIPKDLVNLIFVGSNDGMLHAFKSETGEEVFAYIPDAVYETLPTLTEANKQVSVVDGNITIEPVDIKGASGTTWKRILTSTMGGGAKGLFALDITDPRKLNDLAKWEYSELESKLYQKLLNPTAKVSDLKSNIGNIIGKPGIVQLADGTWVAVLGNGYNSESRKAALIVIDLDTGKPIQELVLENDTDGYTIASQPNGLGPAYFVSYPGKSTATAAYVDRAYAGDLQGNMWVFDFTKSSKSCNPKTGDKCITVAKQSGTTKQVPLFTATDTSGKRQPITTAPLVRQHPKKYGYLVHFGTGALFEENDLSSNVNNSIYAIWDDWVPAGYKNGGGLPTPRTGQEVKRDQLREVTFNVIAGETVSVTGGAATTAKIRKLAKGSTVNQPIEWAISGNTFVTKKRGWYADLLPNERAWQPAFITYGSNNVQGIGYNTVKYTANGGGSTLLCDNSQTGVISWQLSFNPNDGTQKLPYYGTLDINLNGDTDSQDLITSSGPTPPSGKPVLEPPVGLEGQAIQYNSSTKEIYSSPWDEPSNRFCNYRVQVNEDSTGNVGAQQICRSSHAASWRQVND